MIFKGQFFITIFVFTKLKVQLWRSKVLLTSEEHLRSELKTLESPWVSLGLYCGCFERIYSWKKKKNPFITLLLLISLVHHLGNVWYFYFHLRDKLLPYDKLLNNVVPSVPRHCQSVSLYCYRWTSTRLSRKEVEGDQSDLHMRSTISSSSYKTQRRSWRVRRRQWRRNPNFVQNWKTKWR